MPSGEWVFDLNSGFIRNLEKLENLEKGPFLTKKNQGKHRKLLDFFKQCVSGKDQRILYLESLFQRIKKIIFHSIPRHLFLVSGSY